ncbi:MAG TPA: phosphate ABC transporter substrate-binding protein PstS [Acidimicrobiales bacterium]|nr:phosphate ABC transporter substrate-binding protein PstS [Acidimicrobiales bacterium]
MSFRHLAEASVRPSRYQRSLATRLGRVTLATLAGALALSGTAGIAGASTHQSKNSASTSNPYAKVEKQLTLLEKPPSGVSLLETGSTLLYPVISEWASQYSAVRVTTAGTGSGTGISDATNGTVQIGASDAYLSSSASSNLLNIPVDVSAQQIDYNLPGLSTKHLHLDATVINDIFDGSITNWNDRAIASLNPGVKLPNMTIVPIHRSDGSGDTFMFSSYLAFQDPTSWVPSHGGPNTSVTWPNVTNALAENGNGGVLAGCEKVPGCIAYIGISWLRSAIAFGLGDAALENGSGKYVLPTPGNIASEVASYKKIPTSAAISLINSKFKSARFGYPIVNFEYAIVNTNQSSAATAQAIKAFLAWGMDPRHGSSDSELTKFYFHPLAPAAMQIAVNLLQRIG